MVVIVRTYPTFSFCQSFVGICTSFLLFNLAFLGVSTTHTVDWSCESDDISGGGVVRHGGCKEDVDDNNSGDGEEDVDGGWM